MRIRLRIPITAHEMMCGIWGAYLSQTVNFGWLVSTKACRGEHSLPIIPHGCRWSFSLAGMNFILMFLKRPFVFLFIWFVLHLKWELSVCSSLVPLPLSLEWLLMDANHFNLAACQLFKNWATNYPHTFICRVFSVSPRNSSRHQLFCYLDKWKVIYFELPVHICTTAHL